MLRLHPSLFEPASRSQNVCHEGTLPRPELHQTDLGRRIHFLPGRNAPNPNDLAKRLLSAQKTGGCTRLYRSFSSRMATDSSKATCAVPATTNSWTLRLRYCIIQKQINTPTHHRIKHPVPSARRNTSVSLVLPW